MKIASRYLLPLELFMSLLLVSWGIAGWVGHGVLGHGLASQGINVEWGIALCGIGFAQFSVGSFEWFGGKRWETPQLHLAVLARMWLAFLAGAVWLYVCYFMIVLKGEGVLVSLALQAPAGVMFSAWIFAGNSKTEVLLNPNLKTDCLERTIIADRERLLRAR